MISRYSRPVMSKIWTEENKYNAWLEIEILACEAWAELGQIPKQDVKLIKEKAVYNVQRIKEIEKQTKHDVVAFTRAVAETLGPESKWIHYGLTSTDVVDTALGYLLKQANKILIEGIEKLLDELRQKALQYKYTVMMGRTHGVHAEPITFGLKLALWYTEMQRNLIRLKNSASDVEVGKISGAVGTFANIDPYVEEYVCQKLGIGFAPISTQVLQRDRHANYIHTLALIATSLDKFATEIRGLQRSEIREVEEGFAAGQKGSSAMPHKRNPITCENISGLARIMRSYTIPAYEDMVLWNERDISHSSVERIMLPDATILLDFMLHRFYSIVKNLRVFPHTMKNNMSRTYGLIYSQRVLLALINKGVTREQAYDLIQSKAMEAWENQTQFKTLIKQEELIQKHLTKAELDNCFDYNYHLRHIDKIFNRVGIH